MKFSKFRSKVTKIKPTVFLGYIVVIISIILIIEAFSRSDGVFAPIELVYVAFLLTGLQMIVM